MPGIDQILETILSTARQEAEATLSEADNRCDIIRRESRADVDTLRENMNKTTRSRCAEIENRAVIQSRLGRRRARLAARQALIQEVFDRALEKLAELPDDRFAALTTALLLEAASSGREQVITAPGETRLNAALLERANAALAARGLPGQLRLSAERAPIRGGFILEENGVLTNCSFEMLLRQLRSGIEAEVSQTLFAGEEE